MTIIRDKQFPIVVEIQRPEKDLDVTVEMYLYDRGTYQVELHLYNREELIDREFHNSHIDGFMSLHDIIKCYLDLHG